MLRFFTLLCCVCGFLALDSTSLRAQRTLSPGIQMSWVVDQGFSIGAEVSILGKDYPSYAGLVIDLDFASSGKVKLHLGGEAFFLDLGPAITYYKGKFISGWNFTAYAALGGLSGSAVDNRIVPYFFGTWTVNFHDPNEVNLGMIGKYYPNATGLNWFNG